MSRHVYAAAALWFLAAGCTTGVAPARSRYTVGFTQGGALSAGLPTDRVWSATARLSWDEFKGPPPSAGVEGARTVYLLRYESRCHGTTFQFDVAAVFVPDQSWVKPEVLASPGESARVLQHERTHFDLTEVYARRMRKYFAELYNPCGQSDEQVGAAIDRFVGEEATAQQRYDVETSYGLTAPRQRAWDERVAAMLSDLDAFTRRSRP